jgi:3-deoxy-D-manno-octulosonic acid kinase
MRAKLPAWMEGEFVIRESGPAAAIVRSDFADLFDHHRLIEAAGDAPRPVLVEDGEALPGGRTATRVISAGALGEAVVRRYRRGGLVERVSTRRYLGGDRAFNELALTHRLRMAGAPVPEVLAAVQADLRPGYAACLITRRIQGAFPAGGLLAEASRGEVIAILEAMGRSVRQLHDAGGWHADLNANNLLVPVGRAGVPVIVIDLDKGRFYVGGVPRWMAARNLRRLRRSLRKLGCVEALAAWPAFRKAYDSPPGPPAAA